MNWAGHRRRSKRDTGTVRKRQRKGRRRHSRNEDTAGRVEGTGRHAHLVNDVL
jgi:hypothetical protein